MTATTDQEQDGSARAADGIWVTFRESPPAVWVMLAGVVINSIASFLQLFLVLFMTERGYSAAQAGFALGSYGGGAVLGMLVGGVLADRLGPRNSIVISMTGSAALIGALLYAPNYPMLLVTVLLVSAVAQFYRPAAQTLIAELTPPHRLVMVTAMYRLALNIGITLAPLLGAALATISYDWLFRAEALAALGYAVLAFVALPRRPRSPGTSTEAAAVPVPPKSSYAAVLRDRRYMFYLVAMFLNSVVYVQYVVTLPLDIAKEGLSVWWFSVAVSLNGLLVITCELVATRVVQRWPLRIVAGLGLGLVGVGYAIYGIAPLAAVIIVGTLIWTLGEIIGGPTLFAHSGLVAPPHLRGRYAGAMHAAFGLGTAVGPVLGAFLWFHAGRAVWLWFALISGLAVVFGLIGFGPRTSDGATSGPSNPTAESDPTPARRGDESS
ncbi:MFS transporter [Micromonospora sp. DT231]|uniref:MFS transporter n=1 Tax=Micromonospora sp. DT231 TaxID=3416526 RepID=UPI003CE90C9F